VGGAAALRFFWGGALASLGPLQSTTFQTAPSQIIMGGEWEGDTGAGQQLECEKPTYLRWEHMSSHGSKVTLQYLE
jgi:hypothetical protein